jgi:hypothetical protein
MSKLRDWLQARLGRNYPAFVSTVDRAVATFLEAFLAVWLAAGLDLPHLTNLSVWQKAATAGLTAALSVVKSLIVTRITGVPALGSLVSTTLRARREQPAPQHYVPLRPSVRRHGR